MGDDVIELLPQPTWEDVERDFNDEPQDEPMNEFNFALSDLNERYTEMKVVDASREEIIAELKTMIPDYDWSSRDY